MKEIKQKRQLEFEQERGEDQGDGNERGVDDEVLGIREELQEEEAGNDGLEDSGNNRLGGVQIKAAWDQVGQVIRMRWLWEVEEIEEIDEISLLEIKR